MKTCREKILLPAIIASALITYSLPVHAEQANEFQLDETVVTATRVSQPIMEIPGDVTVISAKEIEQKGATNLADALRGAPGVNIKTYGSAGTFADIYINGSDRVVYLIDGKRINVPQGVGDGQGTIDLSTILLASHIDHIEVVRGGGSALYGSDAVGGVVNIITKKGSGKTATDLTIQSGNHNNRKYVLSNQGEDKGFRWYITGLQEKTDGQRPNSQYDGKMASIRLDQAINNKENLEFTYDYLDSHSGMPYKMQLINGQYGWNTSQDTTSYGDVLRNNWGLSYTKQLDQQDFNVKIYRNNQVYQGYNYGDYRHENTVNAVELQNNLYFYKNHLLTWGGSWLQEKVNSTNEGSAGHDRTIQALYLQDQYKWTEKLMMTTGIRYDDNSQYGSNWLPKLAFNYRADTTTSYFASWGKVFKAPTFDDLYWVDPSGWMNGNPNLKPETGWTAETGVKKQLDQKNEFMVSLFKQKLNNAIRWTDDWSTTENLDKFTSTGANMSLTSKINDHLSTNLSYTYTNSLKDGDAYTGVARNMFGLGIHYKQGNLSQSINGYYTDASGLNANRVNSHFVWDTRLDYAYAKDRSVYLLVNNIFDKKFQTISGYPGEERGLYFGVNYKL